VIVALIAIAAGFFMPLKDAHGHLSEVGNVDWPVSTGENLSICPATSVVTTTERTFVIASVNGRAHWIDVRKGPRWRERFRRGLSAADHLSSAGFDEIVRTPLATVM